MNKTRANNLISVKEAIMRLLIDDHRKWYSSRAITAHLQTVLGRNVKPTCYLLRLIKSGHIERAYKPEHLTNSKYGQKEFIYRWTRKPYRDKIEIIKQLPYDDLLPVYKAQIMRFLKTHYPDLPAPNRRMLL